jgi:hypothetical protein
LEYRREHYRANKRSYYFYESKYKFGVTKEQYDEMVEWQGEVCASCGDKFGVRPAIDHDHLTGRFRGILCLNCNTALGKLKDDPVRIRKLADYLERARQWL